MFTAFSHQESSISGNTHQHVLSLNTGQTGVVPPGAHTTVWLPSNIYRFIFTILLLFQMKHPTHLCIHWWLTLCSRVHWAEEQDCPASSQTRYSAEVLLCSGKWGSRGCQTPGCQSGRSGWSQTPGENGSCSAGLGLSAWMRKNGTQCIELCSYYIKIRLDKLMKCQSSNASLWLENETMNTIESLCSSSKRLTVPETFSQKLWPWQRFPA